MPGQPGPPGHPGPPVSAGGGGRAMWTPAPQSGGHPETSTMLVALSHCPALILQGEQGPDGPIGKEVRVGPGAGPWHLLAWPWCPQGACAGDIPATLLLCVSPGPPRKTWHGGTSRPEGEGRARPCRCGCHGMMESQNMEGTHKDPGAPQPRVGLGMPGLSPASPHLCRVKLDLPARGATPGRRAEPACPGGRGRAAPWASWGRGGLRERGAPPARRDLRAALGCRAPQG